MTDFNSGPIRNIEAVNKFIGELPYGTRKAAIEAVAEYIVGDSNHGLKHDDPYKQTTRLRVYGRTFESDAQRRYVMAAIADGRIVIGQRKYSPTRSSEGYGYKTTNDGYNATITNTSPGAYWARGWGGWRNWREFTKVVEDNLRGAMRHAMAGVNEWLKTHGKK